MRHIQGKSRIVKMKLRDLANPKWIYRSWYYFRLGYGTYLTFILGYASQSFHPRTGKRSVGLHAYTLRLTASLPL